MRGDGQRLRHVTLLRRGASAPVDRTRARSDQQTFVGVGRFTNPDVMASVIGSGALDLIGAARPAIADPFLPTKIREGRPDEIRNARAPISAFCAKSRFAVSAASFLSPFESMQVVASRT